MLTVAEDSIAATLRTGEVPPVDERLYEPALRAVGATFVTLERGSALLGCIGTLEPVRPLIRDVAHNAVAAAFEDPRLPAIGPDDYEVMAIEISVLSELEPLPATSLGTLATALRPGIDGLVVDARPRPGHVPPRGLAPLRRRRGRVPRRALAQGGARARIVDRGRALLALHGRGGRHPRTATSDPELRRAAAAHVSCAAASRPMEVSAPRAPERCRQ